ncbi:YSIRK-type signal peptide-containing protein, partial [Klebsiella variicola]
NIYNLSKNTSVNLVFDALFCICKLLGGYTLLSKNNKKQYNLKHSNGQQHFSFRKTTVGLASVLLSTTLYLGVNSGFVVQ